MNAGYVKLGRDNAVTQLVARTDPTLACWAALVQKWDGIEDTLDDSDPPDSAENTPPSPIRLKL
ncbi:MAG TPA: hypothetical protein VF774_18340 [Pseudoduganella sp.]|jgi:hypothetical protein